MDDTGKQSSVDADELVRLGRKFDTGHGALKNYAKAAELYRKAADLGDQRAEYLLGRLYEEGRGVLHDIAAAAACYERAVRGSHPGAAYRLACLIETGLAPEQAGDVFTLFRFAALHGHPRAPLRTAQLAKEGHVPVAYAAETAQWQDAAEWIEAGAWETYLPALRSRPYAVLSVAEAYHTGRPVHADRTKAARWYERALEVGDQYDKGQAYLRLGDLAAAGPAPDSLEKAKAYYVLADVAGEAKAKERLADLRYRQADALERWQLRMRAAGWPSILTDVKTVVPLLFLVLGLSAVGLWLFSGSSTGGPLTGLSFLAAVGSLAVLAVLALAFVYGLIRTGLASAPRWLLHASLTVIVLAALGGALLYLVPQGGPLLPSTESDSAPSSGQEPESPTISSEAAEAAYARGNRAFHDEDYVAAIAAYSEAIEQNPQSALYYLARGNVRLTQMDYDQARADYDQAIELDPMNGPAYFAKGTLAWMLGELDAAEQDYREAVRLEPDDSFFYNRLSGVLYERDTPQAKSEVIRLYRSAYEENPERAWALSAWMNVLFAEKRYDELLERAGQLTKRGVESAGLLYYVARIHAEREEVPQGIQAIEEALRLDPDNIDIEAYFVAADLYKRAGEVGDCERYLEGFGSRQGRPMRAAWCRE